jgi:hypothetical protein
MITGVDAELTGVSGVGVWARSCGMRVIEMLVTETS